MIVKLRRKERNFQDLTPGQPYVVLGIEADEIRVLNDSGRPFLYPPSLFEALNSTEPSDWVTEIGENGERYAYPAPFAQPGFFEDFFDDKPKAVKTFWRVVNQQLAAMSEVA